MGARHCGRGDVDEVKVLVAEEQAWAAGKTRFLRALLGLVEPQGRAKGRRGNGSPLIVAKKDGYIFSSARNVGRIPN